MKKHLKWRPLQFATLLAGVFAALSGLMPGSAHAEKSIDFYTSGSVTSTLVFNNQVVPDTYTFFASAGESIRLQTSNNGFDTTIRVIGPDAAINLFNDDSNGTTASLLTFTAADAGAYIVVVSSYSGNPVPIPNATYTLRFARGAAAKGGMLYAPSPEDDLASGSSDPDVRNEVEDKQ